MLDIAVVRVLSILFAVGSMGNLFAYGFFLKNGRTWVQSKHLGTQVIFLTKAGVC